jgi:hypothetical protein
MQSAQGALQSLHALERQRDLRLADGRQGIAQECSERERNKGSMTSKLHAACDSKGRPISFFVSGGQVSDYIGPGH